MSDDRLCLALQCGSVKSLTDSGELSGYGAVFNNIDRGNEIILPGAFRESIDDFVKSGHLCADHNWKKRLGTISSAREDSHGLFFKAQFYSTKFAQDMRKQVRERIDRGKNVGLSVGYRIVDEDRRKSDGVRLLKKLVLFEISVVSVPMNALAMAASAKGDIDREYQRLRRLAWESLVKSGNETVARIDLLLGRTK
jgi:HK97 family phage prohead protease